jgi:hypothetical protein
MVDYVDVPVVLDVNGLRLRRHKSVVVARKGVGSVASRVIDACKKFFGDGHLEVEHRKIYHWNRKK